MKEFPKTYNAEEAEEKWYDFWVEKGYFRPEINPEGSPYCIVIPPPNVTGSLHMGHALNATLQDILVRWMRMRGMRALWLPGTDHAGIATQNVVERMLEKQGLSRHGLGREEFIKKVRLWKEEYGGRIIHQLKELGASCDWQRERFTLDEGLSRAVREVFVRLYEDGLIYRAERLINWCPRCHTALSDLEVEHEELQGELTYIKYPLSEGAGHVTVATTRPETMLGDTAVAVNPEDDRWKGSIGGKVRLPLTERLIPVIGDGAVEPAFGSGAVKITPAHDFNDEEVAKRHGLPSITVIGKDGKMTPEAGPKYAGLDRYEARRRVLEDLHAQGLIERSEPYKHSVGHCYRCKTIIEPLGMPQWFVKVGPLAGPAIKAVKEGKIRIIPEGWANSYYAWMENIKDWCISRQIWWGHRIPVWHCADCGEANVARSAPEKCRKCGSAALRQDEDVLDTWFSSALWPFSTLGWPEKTPDLKAFYPTSVLVTAFDILFFWVARMIMMGLRFMGDVPFRDVYIHALVRDPEGRKMSKSKGNVIDPLTLIEKYGADAFRFTLAAFAAQGRDIRFSTERVEGYRHFINKLWNAARFIEGGASGPSLSESGAKIKLGIEDIDIGRLPLSGRWILSRLHHTIEEVNASLEAYRFNEAAGSVYHFLWHEFCDWYIETAKTEIENKETAKCLLYVLETTLRLLHPFMPFVTEELWQSLPLKKGESITVAPYPKGARLDEEAEAVMTHVMDAVSAIRTIRGELNIPPAAEINAVVRTGSNEAGDALAGNIHYIKKLARARDIRVGADAVRPEGSAISIRGQCEVYVPIAGLIDIEAELGRLGKDMQKTEESIRFVEGKLANEDFVRNAPESVIIKERQKLDELRSKRDRLVEGIEKLGSLRG